MSVHFSSGSSDLRAAASQAAVAPKKSSATLASIPSTVWGIIGKHANIEGQVTLKLASKDLQREALAWKIEDTSAPLGGIAGHTQNTKQALQRLKTIEKEEEKEKDEGHIKHFVAFLKDHFDLIGLRDLGIESRWTSFNYSNTVITHLVGDEGRQDLVVSFFGKRATSDLQYLRNLSSFLSGVRNMIPKPSAHHNGQCTFNPEEHQLPTDTIMKEFNSNKKRLKVQASILRKTIRCHAITSIAKGMLAVGAVVTAVVVAQKGYA